MYEEARQILARLSVSAWGIALRMSEEERSVALPTIALADPPWRADTRPAGKLSRE